MDTPLDNFSYYTIKIKGNPNYLFLYTYPSYNERYTNISTENIENISIGTNTSNSIVYQNPITDQKQLIITKENNLYYIETNPESKTNCYLNNRIVDEKKILNLGDILFINNLKIIWMNNHIR